MVGRNPFENVRRGISIGVKYPATLVDVIIVAANSMFAGVISCGEWLGSAEMYYVSAKCQTFASYVAVFYRHHTLR